MNLQLEHCTQGRAISYANHFIWIAIIIIDIISSVNSAECGQELDFKSLRKSGCLKGSKIRRVAFTESIAGYIIEGPVMSSITTDNERECEQACFLAKNSTCSTFNYCPGEKKCELLYNNRGPGDYSVKKEMECSFGTHQCKNKKCEEGYCYLIGDEKRCVCKQGYKGETCNESE
ncbi:uncharacterized protein LOC110233155 [Exaiptasia diaphana]|uniref:Apple domain-containing protein n=1 Tax=Exaiptasia diaphana TaxID=2652724 RepID=A0A913YDN6_EXADI|nr:uncharacterized protein LOC110233155 [Exaiptasia diaphana]